MMFVSLCRWYCLANKVNNPRDRRFMSFASVLASRRCNRLSKVSVSCVVMYSSFELFSPFVAVALRPVAYLDSILSCLFLYAF